MPDARWETMQRLFTAALELPAPARAAYLEEACADDPALRTQVGALLAAHERSNAFLEYPWASEAETTLPDAPGPAMPGPMPVVPGFRIVRELGRGGMGIVYEAERAHPGQTVALKVLKPSFAQPSLRRRFEHEIHLLARLRHPGIAQIYDAGVVPSPMGPLPYFAMELVEGRALDAVARDGSVTLRERLRLLAEIADAVEHAHQKAILHRDLKPNNILVTREGRPKILDFGVARALDPELQLTTMQTELGQLIGTLPYMSPEQASGDLDQLDTRSDVYSLGVVAYELLAGRPPYDLTEKLLPEAVRMIREDEPGRLSTIDRACRGDVETIVAKALEKQRERRYQSVAEFAADIRRFLSDEPIVARPPSRVYLARKFARRHRSLVAGAAAALGVLVAGAVVSTALALRLADSNAALGDTVGELRVASAAALAQAETARAVNEFYTTHLLLAAAPEASLGREITIREALDDASSRVDAELAAYPEAAGKVHAALASVFRRLDMPERSLHHGAAAVERYRGAFGDGHPEVYHAMVSYAQLLRDGARYDEAEPLRERAIAGLRETVGDAHPYTLAAMTGRASVLIESGEPALAVPLLEATVAGYRAMAADPAQRDPENQLNACASLAYAYDEAGRSAEAEAALRRGIEEAGGELDADHPIMMGAMNGLGAILLARGDYAGVLPIVEAVAASAARVLGPEHINTLVARQNLARTLSAVGRFGEAEPIWLEIIPVLGGKLPDPHPLAANIIQAYGISLVEHGRPGDAIPRLAEAHRQFAGTMGEESGAARATAKWLSRAHEQTGDEAAAAAWRARGGG
ncbi:MAG: protein kinase [Phycisphaerales bacterium]|nr:protein kinase [Phycisphaerales bacterium]